MARNRCIAVVRAWPMQPRFVNRSRGNLSLQLAGIGEAHCLFITTPLATLHTTQVVCQCACTPSPPSHQHVVKSLRRRASYTRALDMYGPSRA